MAAEAPLLEGDEDSRTEDTESHRGEKKQRELERRHAFFPDGKRAGRVAHGDEGIINHKERKDHKGGDARSTHFPDLLQNRDSGSTLRFEGRDGGLLLA